jgi:hypothetical protein
MAKVRDMAVRIGFVWLRIGSNEHCKQLSDYVKGGTRKS